MARDIRVGHPSVRASALQSVDLGLIHLSRCQRLQIGINRSPVWHSAEVLQRINVKLSLFSDARKECNGLNLQPLLALQPNLFNFARRA